MIQAEVLTDFFRKSNLRGLWKLHRSWLQVLVIILLTLGIFFRFFNLDRKVYWHDETLTSLRTFGYTKAELVDETFTGQVITVKDLQQYQHPSPDKDLDDTIEALAGNAEHPPLYYLMARFWAEGFGSSVAAMRSLPAFTSLLAFPCIYWLCVELFGSPLVGWMAVALVAVSPFHVLYAQEAREYSLWIVAILLSSASLLRAIRVNSKLSWGIYAVTVALGLYTHILAGLVTIGHTIYVFANKSLRTSKTLIPYLLATLAGVLAFLPWLLIILDSWDEIHETTAGVRRGLSSSGLIDKWFLNFTRIFADAELGSANILLVALAVFSLYFVCRKTSPETWMFILTLTGVTALTLMVPDVVSGGRRSTVIRYVTPCCLGIQLAVAYFLSRQITAVKIWQQKLGWTLIAILVSAGIITCAITAEKEVWWTKSRNRSGHYPAVARIINQANNPLVVSDGGPIGILALSHRLEPTTQLQLMKELREFKAPNIPDTPGDLFLLSPSEDLFNHLGQTYNLHPLYQHKKVIHLWKMQKR